MSDAYHRLETRFAQLHALDGAASILHWDSEVILAPGSLDVRAEQLSALAALRHEKLTDPELEVQLARAGEDEASLDDWQRANLREMRREFAHATAVPDDLVRALSEATTRCEYRWRTARAENDYAGLRPYLGEVIHLTREAAAAKAAALDLSPYDALLDQYDPGLRSEEIDGYFTELERFLPAFMRTVMEKQATETPPEAPDSRILAHKQAAIAEELLTRFGFDFNCGKISISTHPFCGGVPGDIRLTTRFDEENLFEGLYATIHEMGHARYEMGLPESWRRQPVGRARGMSLHESQSLLLEMQVGLSPQGIGWVMQVVREHLRSSGELAVPADAWSDEAVRRRLTRVQPSLIRVTADEVSYPLHILLRYKLEKALLAGELSVEDLPGAWDDEMQRLLGIRPPDVAQGCLQDTHWPGGAIGYFPTYTLGAMIAAQLIYAIRRDLPNIAQDWAKGEFGDLFDWLGEHVHRRASLLFTPQLVQQATGQPLNVALYKQHLTERYLGY